MIVVVVAGVATFLASRNPMATLVVVIATYLATLVT